MSSTNSLHKNATDYENWQDSSNPCIENLTFKKIITGKPFDLKFWLEHGSIIIISTTGITMLMTYNVEHWSANLWLI